MRQNLELTMALLTMKWHYVQMKIVWLPYQWPLPSSAMFVIIWLTTKIPFYNMLNYTSQTIEVVQMHFMNRHSQWLSQQKVGWLALKHYSSIGKEIKTVHQLCYGVRKVGKISAFIHVYKQ